jgi:hypothetical protein
LGAREDTLEVALEAMQVDGLAIVGIEAGEVVERRYGDQ